MIAAVIDNTVLSNFAHIREPRLLAGAFAQLVTVNAVMTELAVGVALGRISAVDWAWLPVVELSEEERTHAEKLGETLGRGEAECIALAASRGWLVLTDDRDARRTAQAMGLMISGTLGALANLVRAQALSLEAADTYLEVMKQYGYHAPIRSLSELI